MSNVTSRIVNVIETRQDDEITYFTLEGVMIGGFKGGSRVEPKEPEVKKEKPGGGVIKSPNPEQVRRQKDKEAESLQTAEGRLKHLKDDVA
jgi:hypothetical protein